MDEFSIGINDSEQVKQLKRRIIRLESQLEILKNMNDNLKGGNLLISEDIDLYPGEQHDFILSILEQARLRCAEGSRPRDILESILRMNTSVGIGHEILSELNRVFKKGNPSTDADTSALKALGFTFTPSRKHPKLRFHDKYMVVLPSSPSDSKRGSLNCLSEINKCIAVGQKI